MADAHAWQAQETSLGLGGMSDRGGLAGRDRVFAWIAILALALVHLYLAGSNKFGLLDGELADTDSYTWMVRATDLMTTGDWFDASLKRVNPPQGLDQHWTRPIDALIVGAALPLTLFMDTEQALYASGALISPLLHVIGLAVLLWGAGPLLGRGRLPLLAILYLAQVGIIGYSAAGRPDHHALILLLTNAMIVLGLRVAMRPPDRKLSLTLGAIMALGLWAGAEFLVTAFGCLLGFGLLWLKDGPKSGISGKMLWAGIGGTVMGTIALVLERGGDLFAPAFQVDSFSAFHVCVLAVTAAFWAAVRWAERRTLALGRIKARTAMAAGLAGVALVVLAFLFPPLLALDLVPMDPFYRQTRYSNILEFQPLLDAHSIAAKGLWDVLSTAILQVGICLPAFAFLIWSVIREPADPRRPLWLLLAIIAGVMLVVYTVQGGIEFRDAPFLQFIALMPYAELCYRLVTRVSKSFSGLRLSVIRPVLLMMLIGWYVFPASIASATEDEEGPAITGRNACPVGQVVEELRKLNDPQRLQIVMAFVDFGPEIMYRTPHAVLSIPNHHAQPGYRQTWDAMTAGNPKTARRLIAGRGVDFVLICDSAITRRFYGQLGATNTFREALIDGHVPGWLVPLPLPKSADGFHLYRVDSGGMVEP